MTSDAIQQTMVTQLDTAIAETSTRIMRLMEALHQAVTRTQFGHASVAVESEESVVLAVDTHYDAKVDITYIVASLKAGMTTPVPVMRVSDSREISVPYEEVLSSEHYAYRTLSDGTMELLIKVAGMYPANSYIQLANVCNIPLPMIQQSWCPSAPVAS